MIQTETLAKLACAYSGVVWGLFWIPLRAMDEAGISGGWSTLMFYVVPLVLTLPLLFWRWRPLVSGGFRLHLTGFIAGLSLVCYANALIYTEIVHAMLLFYLTPVWSTLLARCWLKEPITRVRVVAIALGTIGILVVFGIDEGLPWPRNIGDWMGLASGALWAVAAVRLRDDHTNKAPEFTLVYFAWGTIIAVAFALLPFEAAQVMPSSGTLTDVLPWLVPTIIILVIPSALAIFWGAALLSPGTVALLFMTEISVGAITAALWAGEPFAARELIGVLLITSAGLAESLPQPLSLSRKKSGACYDEQR